MRQPDNDRWILAAALQATRGMELAVLQQLLSIRTDPSARNVTDIRQLTESAAASASPGELTELVKASASRIEATPTVAVAMLNGLEAGLRSNKSSETARSLNQWLSNPPPDASDDARSVAGFIDGVPDRLADPSRALEDRLNDATLAALLPTAVLLQMADGVLASGCPSQLQLAILHQLQQRRDDGIPELMMQHWSALHPGAQSDVLDWMLSRPATTAIVLQQMQARKVPPAAVTIDQRMRLLQHRDEDIRQTASQLVLCHAYDLGWAGKTGSGTENRNGPKGALHFRYLTPFSSE
jgi:hypothetical protein